MRPGAPTRLVLGCAGLAGLLGVGPVARADGPTDGPAGVAALESPRFEERRDAEKALFQEGMSVLAALAAGDADVDARIASFDRTLAGCETDRTPAAARAAARIATRLETSATDDQVRRIPRLLRVRLDRILPLVVFDRDLEPDGAASARVDGRSVRGLLPEARPILLDRVRATDDPRVLAGALASLCSETGAGVEDDTDLELIGAAWQQAPARFEQLYRFESVDGAPPLCTVALALALTGRARDLRRLVRDAETSSWSLRPWIEPRLKARGQGDLTMGRFLLDLEEGRASAPLTAIAAKRALDASIPWLARLLARRALFLDPASADAEQVLAAASDAVGLRSPARRDARPPTAPAADGGPVDDDAAVAIDEALRAGFLSQRLTQRVEAGNDQERGLLSAALDGGRLVYATTRGNVGVLDTAKQRPLFSFGRGVRRGAASLAMRGDEVATVGAAGEVTLWSLDAKGATMVRTVAGSAQAVAAGAHGFWVAGFGCTLSRLTKDKVETFEKVPPIDQFVVRTLGVFPDDSLLVASNDAAWRIAPSTGVAVRVKFPRRLSAVSTCGDDVVAAGGDIFLRIDRRDRITGHGQLPDGNAILGIAAEPDGSTVYVQSIDTLFAMDPKTGEERWVEHIEGSGDPVVGAGLVVARAGTGGLRRGGDGRADRTLFLLRTATAANGPFGVAEREKIVGLATAMAAEGLTELVHVLVDPVGSWLSSEEVDAIESAVMAGQVGK